MSIFDRTPSDKLESDRDRRLGVKQSFPNVSNRKDLSIIVKTSPFFNLTRSARIFPSKIVGFLSLKFSRNA